MIMVAISYFCRQNMSQISLEIVVNCSHPSEILALHDDSVCVVSSLAAAHTMWGYFGSFYDVILMFVSRFCISVSFSSHAHLC